MNAPLLNLDEVVRRQAEWTALWHDGATPPESTAPWQAIEHNHRMNFDLWHEEDVARRDDLGAERVRQAKRVIDRCNQERNDAMEQIDGWLMTRIPPATSGASLHSETPGMMLDRLSILALKLYHMRLEAERASATEEHHRKCRDRCLVLEEQTRDLKRCVEVLLGQLQSGECRFKLYKQLKMYNDATLNPQLYGGQPRAQGESAVPTSRE